MTVYKSIPGYEGIYEAGSDGTIWTCDNKVTFRKLPNGSLQKRTWKRRKLSPKIERRNRSVHHDLRVELWKNGTHKTKLVSRLVASTFLPSKDDKPCVNHIDGNPLNNMLDNLEWVTYSENIKHAYETGLNKEPKKVTLIKKETNEIERFRSMSMASTFLGKNHGYVSDKIKRGIKEFCGYEVV
ncbi:HNH endonuclease [Latilactobacillus curvatus]|uniref:HNH endonuclease n=1 Tax=Latilactobacillus curvatus TaxID=28038 RepID=UPI000DAAD9F0|nr:HNH endonuclease [Latilactobacillus curvatus]AWV72531.1 HNH endonuclease [Latilactobacillus curvatus]